MKTLSLLPIAFAAFSVPAWAAIRSTTLAVPGMTCAACPITVKTALKRVAGVQNVEVNIAKRWAVVRYDDRKTNVAALQKATRDAGYPSRAVHGTRE